MADAKTLTVSIELSPEAETSARRYAEADGLSFEDYVAYCFNMGLEMDEAIRENDATERGPDGRLSENMDDDVPF